MKALIAMSGGVDSSVAAKLILQSGLEGIGCTMKLYANEQAGISESRTCCSLDDVEDARQVAKKLDMPYYVFNFKEEFKQEVINRFICSYENGFTPNPCIECNRTMKFGKLYERARLLGCDYIATGHYAKIEQAGGRFVLKKADDLSKDQSYVLYNMTQQQLKHTLFPLGKKTKAQVRKIAEENGFMNADKPDSQDICFVPNGDYAAVIKLHTAKEYPPGNFIDEQGNVLGRHKGIIYYTIGQRKGLGLAFGEPRYVCKICATDNTVMLGNRQSLFKTDLMVKNFHWISGEAPSAPFRCKAKIRYRQPEQWAMVTPMGNNALISFDEPQRAITPGQSAVLYKEDIVLGGGIIQ